MFCRLASNIPSKKNPRRFEYRDYDGQFVQRQNYLLPLTIVLSKQSEGSFMTTAIYQLVKVRYHNKGVPTKSLLGLSHVSILDGRSSVLITDGAFVNLQSILVTHVFGGP